MLLNQFARAVYLSLLPARTLSFSLRHFSPALRCCEHCKALKLTHTGLQAVVKAAQKAKELDAEHVGIGKAYQTAPEMGIQTTAADLSVKAKEKAAPFVEKAKVAGGNIAEKWKVLLLSLFVSCAFSLSLSRSVPPTLAPSLPLPRSLHAHRAFSTLFAVSSTHAIHAELR